MSDNLAKLIKSLSDAELAERAEAFEQSGDTELYIALIAEMLRRSGEAIAAMG